MNLDLYTFHLRSPARPLDKLVVGSASTSTSTSRGYGSPVPHCTSWNNGLCRWPFGECRFRNVYSSCDGAHPKHGMPCSVTSQCLGSAGTPSGPVPVRSFTPLAPVHVVSHVAIHPQDRSLLGMRWRGKYYVDMALPFGLRSAPHIFTAIADVVEWMLAHNYGVTFLRHYLDDFMTLGPPASPVCHHNLQACIRLCSILGLPLHLHKLEGPTTRLSILGIELDSTTLQAWLPEEKRDRIIALLDTWSAKHFCKRCELESLIGHLHHVCKIAPRGGHFSAG